MDTPVQNPAAGTPQTQAAPTSGAAFLESSGLAQKLAEIQSGQPEQPRQIHPVMPPQPPMQPQAPVPPQMPVPEPPPMPQAPQPPVPPPAPVDYSARFAPQQPQDPLANLQALPELPPEQPVQAPQNLGDQQNHAWAALRAQSNQNRRNAEQYLRQYNELVERTKSFQTERTEFGSKLNEKDKEIESLRNEIGRLDLSRSPEFREKYEAPIYSVHDDMVRTLVDNGVRKEDAEDRVGQILSAQGQQEVAELIGDYPTHVQGMLMIKSGDAFRMMDERQRALDDWKTSQDGLAAVANRGSAMIEAQRRDKLAKAALDAVRSMPSATKIPAYQVVDPQFVADRERHEGEFLKWIQEAPADQQYVAMLEGFMAPKTYEMLQTVYAENQQLKAALYNRGRAAAPVVNPGAPYVPPPPPPPPQQPQPVLADRGNSAEALVGGIFRQAGIMPPGM